MKKQSSAAIVLAAISATIVAAPPAVARDQLTGEAQLAKMLDGREPGKPVNCLPLGQSSEQRIIDKTAIVYRYGSTLYVNRPSNPESLDNDDIMVTKPLNGQLCSVDTVTLIDRNSRFYSGFVGLQQFVPYKKVASAR